MRIAATSDLHADVTPANRELVPYLVQVCREAAADVLLICGDVSPHLEKLGQVLAAFNDGLPNCRKLFVAGNHDIWVQKTSPDLSSLCKYEKITHLCAQHGFHHLGSTPFVINKVGFCGTIGWYDYSFRQESYGLSEEQYAQKYHQGSLWNDLFYAHWGESDSQVARRFEEALQEQIEAVRPKSKRIIVATHHVPFRQCVVYRGELPWDYFNAFMGSQGLGDICLREPLVTHVIFGHTHVPMVKHIEGIMAICSPVDYLHKPPPDLLEYARRRVTFVDI